MNCDYHKLAEHKHGHLYNVELCEYYETQDYCRTWNCPKVKSDIKLLPSGCQTCAIVHECHFDDAEFKINNENIRGCFK